VDEDLAAARLDVYACAALAARACIRHRHTDYEDALDALNESGFWDDEALYQEAKDRAREAVDEFLRRHRRI
jgi:hypothetical protein